MPLYLKNVQVDNCLGFEPELTLTLSFDSSVAMSAFMGELLHGSTIWNSDKLMAMAQLMFEAEQTPKTITQAAAFQKYGKVANIGDTLQVLVAPPGLPTPFTGMDGSLSLKDIPMSTIELVTVV